MLYHSLFWQNKIISHLKHGFTILAFLCLFSVSAQAFEITDFYVNADRESPEACLEFSTPIKIADRNHLATQLQLEMGAKKIQVSPHDLSITNNILCITGLSFREKYRIYLKSLSNLKGEALKTPYINNFEIPARKSILNIAQSANFSGLPQIMPFMGNGKTDLSQIGKIQSVNIGNISAQVFAIQKSEYYAESWQQFSQLSLAPSESLYFASHKGKLAYEAKLDLQQDDKLDSHQQNEKDKIKETNIPLPENGKISPGLYFAAISPQGQKAANPALFAGVWFLVSDLKITALNSDKGLKIFAAKFLSRKNDAEDQLKDLNGKSQQSYVAHSADNIKIYAYANDGALIVDGNTGADGMAILSVNKDNLKRISLIVGKDNEGDLFFLPYNSETENVRPLPYSATLLPDRENYSSGTTATVMLWSKSNSGQTLAPGQTSLKLVGPDDIFYSEQFVPNIDQGPQFFKIQLPLIDKPGNWLLLWQRADGVVLARKKIWVGAGDNLLSPNLTVENDGTKSGKQIDLSISTVRKSLQINSSAPFVAGTVKVSPARPEFSQYKDYFFGTNNKDAHKVIEYPFISDLNGNALISVKDIPFTGAVGLKFTAEIAQSGRQDTRIMPAFGWNDWIGIRPANEGGIYPENSLASFDIISINQDKKINSRNDLYFQIYEEGRNFKWTQTNGLWGYEKLSQHRRIGGGRIKMVNGKATVTWPVSLGQYLLEITTPDGTALAQFNFTAEAGSKQSSNSLSAAVSINDIQELIAGKNNEVSINVDESGMFAINSYSSEWEQTHFEHMNAGLNKFSIAPPEGVGPEVFVVIKPLNLKYTEEDKIVQKFSVHDPDQNLPIKLKETKTIIATPGENFLNVELKTEAGLNLNDLSVQSLVSPVEAPSGLNAPDMPAALSKVEKFLKTKEQYDYSFSYSAPELRGEALGRFIFWNKNKSIMLEQNIMVQPEFFIEGDVPLMWHVGDVTDQIFGVALNSKTSTVSKIQSGLKFNFIVPEGVSVAPAQGKIIFNPDKINNKIIGKNDKLSSEAGKANPRNLEKINSNNLLSHLSVKFKFEKPTSGVIKLVVTMPDGQEKIKSWPIYVPDSENTTGAGEQKIESGKSAEILKSGDGYKSVDVPKAGKAENMVTKEIFVSPIPISNILGYLPQFLQLNPVRTNDLADWLVVAKNWETTLIKAGLIDQTAFTALWLQKLNNLEERQNFDGGFPAVLQGESDLQATTKALKALDLFASTEKVQAIKWVRKSLENPWYGSDQVAERAYAFEALSKVQNVDVSALRYFAQKNIEADLSLSATAAIVLALGRTGENTEFWLQKFKNKLLNVNQYSLEDKIHALVFASEITSIPVSDVLENLEKLLPKSDAKSIDMVSFVQNKLSLLFNLIKREGEMQFEVNSRPEKANGLFIKSYTAMPHQPLMHEENIKSIYKIKNTSKAPIYISTLARKYYGGSFGSEKLQKNMQKAHAVLAYKFYNLDGSKIEKDQSLRSGAYYIFLLEGSEDAISVSSFSQMLPSGLQIAVQGRVDQTALSNTFKGLQPLAANYDVFTDQNILVLIPDVKIMMDPNNSDVNVNKEKFGPFKWRNAIIVQAKNKGVYQWPDAAFLNQDGSQILVKPENTVVRIN